MAKAHENWRLPFLNGHYILEGDNTWGTLMLLKDIVELVVAPGHTEEALNFLNCKISHATIHISRVAKYLSIFPRWLCSRNLPQGL